MSEMLKITVDDWMSFVAGQVIVTGTRFLALFRLKKRRSPKNAFSVLAIFLLSSCKAREYCLSFLSDDF